jgi:hypothetical protein
MSTRPTSTPAPKEQIIPPPEGLKAMFPWRISLLMVIGYLLATVPQVILDPLFSHHVAYTNPRHYPFAWLIAPIAVILFVVTLVVSSKTHRRRYYLAMIPFFVACAVSVPIFAPEIPHGNLLFVCVVWLIFSAVTAWIHDRPIVSPADNNPKLSAQAQIEYIKEQTAIWKACTLGLLAVYLAGIVTATKELHDYDALLIKDPREVFFLWSYTNLELTIMSAYMFFGPIYEAAKKIMDTNQLLLNVSDGSSATSSTNDK